MPLELKINNFSFGELDIFADDNAEVVFESNDEEFFIKCRAIWNRIIALIDIDSPCNLLNTILMKMEMMLKMKYYYECRKKYKRY